MHPAVAQSNYIGNPQIKIVWAIHRRSIRPGLRQRGALCTVATASRVQRPLNRNRPSDQDSSAIPNTSANIRMGPGGLWDIPAVPNAQRVARSLFAALNNRDVSAVLSLLSDDVTYENLGSSTILCGRAAVGQFYLEALASLPEDAVFVLESPNGSGIDPWVSDEESPVGPVLQAGVAWRVELNGLVVPLSRGVGVYWAEPDTGRLARIWDNPEHTLKQGTPSLTSAAWASPLLRDLGPLVMPAALNATSFLSNMVTGGNGEGTVGGLHASGTGGGSGSAGGVMGLAGGMFSTLSSLILPFQASDETKRRTGVSSSGAVAYRDHPQGPAGGSGRGVGPGVADSSRVRGPAGFSAAGPRPQISTGNPSRIRGSNSTITSSSSSRNSSSNSSSGVGGVRNLVAETPNSVSAAVDAVITPNSITSAISSTNTTAGGYPGTRTATTSTSSLKPIRMRPLSNPTSPTASSFIVSASASVASSFASLDEDMVTSATTQGTMAGPTNGGGAASLSKSVAAGRDSFATRPSSSSNSTKSSGSSSGGNGGSNSGGRNSSSMFGSVDTGSDSDAAAYITAAAKVALPFTCSTSQGFNLTGLWEKDAGASQVEEYESMLDVLELGGLQKVTARLIDGLDLRHDEQSFEVGFVTVVPFFRVTEKSRFGATTTMMRRDLRFGRQSVQVSRIPGGVVVDMSWADPLAGSLKEEYVVNEDGSAMAVTSTIRIGTRVAVATQVYRRSNRDKGDFLADKRTSYGSMQDVLMSQEQKFGKIEY